MAAAIGWYGPLIDLCKASSYIGDYVQLLVFVHKSTPIQYKIARNGEVVRMDILVGDETRSYFPVTVWQKHMGSQVLAGHVVLLQNLKVAKFGDTVEARALHCSFLQCLLQPNDFVASKGLDALIGECRVGITARDKLQRVVGWLQRARLAHCGSVLNYYELWCLPPQIRFFVLILLPLLDAHRRQLKVNWKVHEEIRSQNCSSLSELCQCENSCKATFHASVGEIFLPITWVNVQETEAERMFISRRLHLLGQNSLVDDLITTGCQLCGIPLTGRLGTNLEQNTTSLYCQRSSDHLHVVDTIYRPFLSCENNACSPSDITAPGDTQMLYVWDDLKYLPIFVTNKAAELLFGSIPAEKVYSSYKSQQPTQSHSAFKKNNSCEAHGILKATRKGVAKCQLSIIDKSLQVKDKNPGDENLNFYTIWLILLNMLFRHGKNSPFRFKVTVDTSKDWENGRLEMVSVTLPAFGGIPQI